MNLFLRVGAPLLSFFEDTIGVPHPPHFENRWTLSLAEFFGGYGVDSRKCEMKTSTFSASGPLSAETHDGQPAASIPYLSARRNFWGPATHCKKATAGAITCDFPRRSPTGTNTFLPYHSESRTRWFPYLGTCASDVRSSPWRQVICWKLRWD